MYEIIYFWLIELLLLLLLLDIEKEHGLKDVINIKKEPVEINDDANSESTCGNTVEKPFFPYGDYANGMMIFQFPDTLPLKTSENEDNMEVCFCLRVIN